MTWHEKLKRKVKARVPLSLMDVPSFLLRRYVGYERRSGESARAALLRVAHRLADDPEWYEMRMRMKNPSSTERQRRFMCAEYGRRKAGEKTKTGMSKRQLRGYCKKPVVARDKRRKRNPHLTSGKWRFVGMFAKADIPSVKRILQIHGIKKKVTKDQLKGEKGMRELYVERAAWQTAYAAITRLFEVGRAA